MNQWKIQCIHCSQYFDGEKAIWCKCSYQYPTKICPYCLKCACDFKEAFFNFWKGVPRKEKIGSNFILSKKQLPGWFERIGLIKSDDMKDILNEAKISKKSIFKTAYKLGYFDKKEINFLKKIINLTPFDILQGARMNNQNTNIWKDYGGIIIDRVNFNHQEYSIIIFPFGTSTSVLAKVQELLKTLVIPIYLELRIWKIIAEDVCIEREKSDNVEPMSYSIKDWFERLIDEVILLGEEAILIESEAHFKNKSNVYISRSNNWVLHSIAPVDYNSLEWSLQNIISSKGKNYKNNYYIKYSYNLNSMLITISPNNWHILYSEDENFRRLMQIMECKSGLFIIRTYGNAEILGRTLVKLAEKNKYSVIVNNASILGDNSILVNNFSDNKICTLMKYICLVNNKDEFVMMRDSSYINFILAIIDISFNIDKDEIIKGNLIEYVHFLRLRQLCDSCKEQVNYSSKLSNIKLWERNEEGCFRCESKGYINEKIFFISEDEDIKKAIYKLLETEKYDWRDLTLFQPKYILETFFK